MTKKIAILSGTAITFFALGFLFFSFTSKSNQRLGNTPPGFSSAQPISNTVAYNYFRNYHRSTTPAGSQGTLRNKGEAIVQFYVDEATLIAPLRNKAQQLGKQFIGLSAIPAYDDDNSTNTLIWVAVVDADPSAGVTPELMLPQRGEQWQDYIYDYIAKCPTECPESSQQLWNKDWNP